MSGQVERLQKIADELLDLRNDCELNSFYYSRFDDIRDYVLKTIEKLSRRDAELTRQRLESWVAAATSPPEKDAQDTPRQA